NSRLNISHGIAIPPGPSLIFAFFHHTFASSRNT
ncbi:hypothetical protein A2U01_0103073, partial [Trifolium medium]|nr:hypothetical protein [Trifolium medium]